MSNWYSYTLLSEEMSVVKLQSEQYQFITSSKQYKTIYFRRWQFLLFKLFRSSLFYNIKKIFFFQHNWCKVDAFRTSSTRSCKLLWFDVSLLSLFYMLLYTVANFVRLYPFVQPLSFHALHLFSLFVFLIVFNLRDVHNLCSILIMFMHVSSSWCS